MKLWGGRFESGPAESFERFSGSLHFDKRLFEADIEGSRAFANELLRVGILSTDEHGRIREGFDKILEQSKTPGFFDADDEDVHTFVIRKLGETAGAVADKIHTGRSRNEQVAADFRIWMKREVRADQRRLEALMASLLDLAQRFPDALLPGYTHLRRAQGVLFPHYLLAYFEMFARDWRRLEQAWERADALPLGSGALAGSGFPFDRERMAGELGFSAVSANSLDAVSDRDFALDFLYAASVAMLHVSRLAEDWILYGSEEFGFLEPGEAVSSGSSLMPQKRNPDALELLRGKAGRVCGHLHALMLTLKGLPLAYNRDLQEDKEGVFDAADQFAASLEMLKLCVDTVGVNPRPMEQAAEQGWVCAAALAEALARKGVPFHRAHRIVGGIVLESIRLGKRAEDWSIDELQAFAPEFDAEAQAALRPRAALENHAVPGGTAPRFVAQALAAAAARLDAMKQQTAD